MNVHEQTKTMLRVANREFKRPLHGLRTDEMVFAIKQISPKYLTRYPL